MGSARSERARADSRAIGEGSFEVDLFQTGEVEEEGSCEEGKRHGRSCVSDVVLEASWVEEREEELT